MNSATIRPRVGQTHFGDGSFDGGGITLLGGGACRADTEGESLVDGVAVISLRLLDILPANGEPLLLQLLIVNEVFRLVALTVTIIMFVSMVADTLDAQELDTGLRQEGVFSAAISFSGKAVSGFGVLITGLLLDYVIGFPQSASPDTVATETVFRLGVVGGIIVPLFYIVPFYMATRYNISRQRHAEIRTALAERYQQS